jgi:cytochrome c553
MKTAAVTSILMICLLSAQSVNAASIYAGEAKAAAVCSQCHGIKSPSADAPFPPLAGRDADYLESALKQYRDKTRKSEIMNNIAGSLTDSDIDNIAAYYARQKP